MVQFDWCIFMIFFRYKDIGDLNKIIKHNILVLTSRDLSIGY